MAADTTKIQLGAGDLWVTSDLTAAPAKGVDLADPTSSALMRMQAGFVGPTTTANPAWRYVGFTQGPANLVYRPTYYMVQTEQAFTEVIVNPTSEEATLAFTMLEADYRNLALAAGQATTEVNGGSPASNALFVGGRPDTALYVAVLASRKRSQVGYFCLTFYQAHTQDGITLNFERRAEMRIAVTLRALGDATRPVGDQLYQLVEYPANPT